MEDKIAWVLLSAQNRTNKKMRDLAKSFDKKKKTADLTGNTAISIMNDIETAAKKGCGFITYIDDDYPEELRNIAYPPPYLYVQGNVELLKYPLKVTIAGSRHATGYGIRVAADFAHELAANNVCIVSGGAEGVDTAAIRGAMRVSNKIIVVVGTGIDKVYPSENTALFKKVAETGGVIVSEFPLGMGPLKQNFPVRNRIMTALGDAVVIAEAAERSGGLISASHAMDQGKLLFAVPGNIDSPNSVGTNNLLRDGVSFALSANDILSDLIDKMPSKCRQAKEYTEKLAEKENAQPVGVKTEILKENLPHLTPYENAVVNAVKSGKDTYEEILEYTNMETNKLTSVLTIMEIKGIIKLAFGNHYKIVG